MIERARKALRVYFGDILAKLAIENHERKPAGLPAGFEPSWETVSADNDVPVAARPLSDADNSEGLDWKPPSWKETLNPWLRLTCARVVGYGVWFRLCVFLTISFAVVAHFALTASLLFGAGYLLVRVGVTEATVSWWMTALKLLGAAALCHTVKCITTEAAIRAYERRIETAANSGDPAEIGDLLGAALVVLLRGGWNGVYPKHYAAVSDSEGDALISSNVRETVIDGSPAPLTLKRVYRTAQLAKAAQAQLDAISFGSYMEQIQNRLEALARVKVGRWMRSNRWLWLRCLCSFTPYNPRGVGAYSKTKVLSGWIAGVGLIAIGLHLLTLMLFRFQFVNH